MSGSFGRFDEALALKRALVVSDKIKDDRHRDLRSVLRSSIDFPAGCEGTFNSP